MSRRVVVIASGETERLALPLLVKHLTEDGVEVQDVRVPPRHQAINVTNAEKIIRSVWFERAEGERPSKFVVLLDTDRSLPEDILGPIRDGLCPRLGNIDASVRFACAQQHLEAWYFADPEGLRDCLGRDLGKVDPSRPDEINNPKLHLKNLLGSRPYTSLVSRDIAAGLNTIAIAQRSPSFRDFIAAAKNGSDE